MANELMKIEFTPEQWLPLVGYEGLYEISSIGRVKRLDKSVYTGFGVTELNEKIMIQRIEKNGYCRIKLCDKGKVKYYMVHRLVAKAFIPNPENKPQVNHLNSNRSDNRVENLEWATNSENQTHSFSNGRIANGRPKKITETQKASIKHFVEAGLTQKEIAKMFQVSQPTISNIANSII